MKPSQPSISRAGRRPPCRFGPDCSVPRALLAAAFAIGLGSCDRDAPAPAGPLFSDQPVWSSRTSVSGGDGIARFIDLDRDGDLDFVTSAPGPRRWVAYLNTDGALATEPVWESAETTDCDHVDVLDFDGDGWTDLAGTHESYCTLFLNREGVFAATPDWETGLIANANQMDFGDYDRDGDLDMVMAVGEPVYGVALFENGTGMPSPLVTRKLGRDEYSETAIFADYDRDGDLDIISAYRGGDIAVFLNADGQFEDSTTVFEDRRNPWTQRLYWRDLDGDGREEIFCAKGPWGGQVGTSLRLAVGEGSAGAEVLWASPEDTAFHGFEFGDVDGDGDLDMVAADYADGGALHLYLADRGTIPAEPAWSVKTTGPAHEAVLGDLDGDGDLDLAVGCRDQAHVFDNLLAGSAGSS